MIQIGAKLINIATNQQGECIGYRKGMPLGRDAEGRLFYGRSPRGRRRAKRMLVRVIDDGDVLTDWMPAKRLRGRGGYLVMSDPVWANQILHHRDVEVMEVEA